MVWFDKVNEIIKEVEQQMNEKIKLHFNSSECGGLNFNKCNGRWRIMIDDKPLSDWDLDTKISAIPFLKGFKAEHHALINELEQRAAKYVSEYYNIKD